MTSAGFFIRGSNTRKQTPLLSKKISLKKSWGAHYSPELFIPLKNTLKIASGCGQSNEVLKVMSYKCHSYN